MKQSGNFMLRFFSTSASPARIARPPFRHRLMVPSSALLFFLGSLTCTQFATAALPSSEPVLGSTTFRIDAVRVEGNTLLSPAVLESVLADLPGPSHSMTDLTQVAARLQRAYREAGYGGVLAFVPPQALDTGQVLIRVVEGKLAKIKVKGNRHFSSSNVRAGLPSLREGATPVVPEVDRDIQLSNENPAKDLKVTLTAGAKPGEIDAEVQVDDKNPLRFSLGYNNSGTDSTGRHRLTIGIEHANLSDRDDVISAQFQTSPGHFDQVKVYGLGYRLPVHSRAATLEAFLAHSDVSNGITQTLVGPLAFSGKGTVLGVRGNLHFDRLGDYDHRLGVGLDWRDYDNNCTLGSLGSAACGPAGVSTHVLPLILSYTGQAQGAQSAWGVNASLFANLGGSDQSTFNDARLGAIKHFYKTRFTAFGQLQLPVGFALGGNLEAQYSPHALISGEQFGLGGASSVRGYMERELAGDYGHAVRAELLGPAFGTESLSLRPLLFVDHGRVVKRKGAGCGAAGQADCSITGAGVGLRLRFSDRAIASVEWARAQDDATQTSSGDTRAHVSIQLAF